MRVSELMTRDPVSIGPDAPLKDAARAMTAHKISGLPVVDDDGSVVGILTEADFVEMVKKSGGTGLLDLLFEEHKPAGAVTVGEVMTRKVVTIEPDAGHVDAARVMHRKKVKRLPVVDGHGKLVGIISRSDLLHVYARSDEEIEHQIVNRILSTVMAVDPSTVEVRVDDGCASLSGELSTRTETQLLEYMVAELPGVISVESKLRFETDDTRYVPEPVPFGVPHRNW